VTLPSTLTTGGLMLDSPFLLSPMEGVSDVAFRRLCFSQGAGLTFTEMIRARGIKGHNQSTLDLIDTHDEATLTGVQLLVTSAQQLLDAVNVLEELAAGSRPWLKNISSIDLNFGCPSPDIIRIGAGPALLKRRAKLGVIFLALAATKRRGVLSVASVSAKIRLGLHQGEQDHKVYLPVVELANGTLDHLVVHARHAKQRSRDAPTWSAIGEAKAAAKIPIVGNGDVRSLADAERMHKETGCDGFMIARAAIKDPWCFRSLRGLGGAPTADEVRAARNSYQEMAARFGTKEKFRTFHADNFARLERVAAGGAASDVVIPKNAHLT
jgi:tRNA-dihydrouridine synthase